MEPSIPRGQGSMGPLRAEGEPRVMTKAWGQGVCGSE